MLMASALIVFQVNAQSIDEILDSSAVTFTERSEKFPDIYKSVETKIVITPTGETSRDFELIGFGL